MSSTTTTTTTTVRAVTANEILRLFPDVNPTVIGAQAARTESNDDLAGYDEEQVRLMDEVCIVIDENDVPIGSGSKKTCKALIWS
jgi:isopentenyl-diphosphate Delta-isomerase